jgi:hypothetical protein
MATNRYHSAYPSNQQENSWYDWASVVQIDPYIKIVRVPVSRHVCGHGGYNDSQNFSRRRNPLAVSDAVDYHLNKAQGYSPRSSRRLTPKQLYQLQRQHQQPQTGYRYRNNDDCRYTQAARKKRVRYYRVIYVYHGLQYQATLKDYPESRIRVHVTPRPAHRQRYGEQQEYVYDVVPVAHGY